MIQAIVFDWDGVLVDSEPIFHRIEKQLLREACGPPLAHSVSVVSDAEIDAAITDMSGMGALEAFEMCRRRLGLSVSSERLVQHYLERMERPYLESPLIPGALAAVRRFRPHVRLAVATSSPLRLLDPLAERLEMKSLFDVMVSAEEVARPKPAPDVYEEAARRLEVDPADCLAIEDTPAGTRAARAAGMRCIAIPRRTTLFADFTGANRIVRSLADVRLEFIEDLDLPRPPYTQTVGAVLYAHSLPHPHAQALRFHQLSACRALAEDKGWTVEGRFEDEGSGIPYAERPGFRALMKFLVDKKDVAVLVVTEGSVLSLGAQEQAEIVRMLGALGVRVHAVYRKEPYTQMRKMLPSSN